MAVDYDEGRRLLAAYEDAIAHRHGEDIKTASADLKAFFHANREALLNPDPWRPISEATSDMPDNVKYILAHKDDPEWICLADGPPEDGRWYSDGWHVEPTHFRELKGPGQ